MWREEGTKPILWGMWICDTSKPLYITEGETDCLAIAECDINNVVSVPSGASDLTWIETCWEWLEKFNKIVFFGDNDNAGQEMIKKAILRLGEARCYIVYHDYKDANEVLYYQGKEAILKAISEAKPVPKIGIIDAADISTDEIIKGEGTPTGIKGLDRIMEDTQQGEVTVWTGKNGEGKSTILGQVILEALDCGASVFCYSGELTKERFQEWINTQAAGSQFLEEYTNKYGDVKTRIKKDANDKIKEWYRGRLFLYDNSIRGKNIEHTGILDISEYAAQRYGCKIFVIDNLMTADFDGTGENYYQAQSKFVGDLVHFAKAFNVHVHLVAHPRKTSNELSKEDISGTGDIANRADNVIAIERNYDESKDYDAILRLLKNRNTGRLGKFPLRFNEKERRFYQINKDGDTTAKIYSWNKDDFIPVEGEAKWPF
jgi:twinkle protein